MSLTALLLVLLAAGCNGAWNLLVKAQARRLEIQLGALAIGAIACSPAFLLYSLGDVADWPPSSQARRVGSK